jgi:hypothetical protein
MKWRDSDEFTNTNGSEPTGNQGFEGDPNAEWDEAAQLNTAKRTAAAASTRNSSVWIVLGVAILGLIIILILPRVRPSGAGEEQILALETRIEALEQQLAKFDSVDDNVSRIWEQAKSFEQFKERFERTDASTSLRMDHLATSLSAVQKRLENLEKSRASAVKAQPPADKTVSTAPKATPARRKPASEIAFHTVAKGDTLYSVGRKYGLKVDQLLEINHLPADTVIKPGQRLRVTP